MSCAAHVSVGILEDLGLVEIRILVLRHPARVVQQAGPRPRVHLVELAPFALEVQISTQRLQEHGVEPPALGVEQVERADVVGGVDARAG